MSQINRLRDAEISNGNLINADDIDVELNQLVAAFNATDLILSDLTTAAYTLAGVKTFSSNPKMNGIDERTANAGVTVDGVLLKDGMASFAGTPTVDGQIGYASNLFIFRQNGVNLGLSNFYSSASSISSNSTVGTTSGQLLICTGFTTLTLTASASLSSLWVCHVVNNGTGEIVIDPNGSETIDGGSTLKIYQGESCTVFHTGSGTFQTTGLQKKGEVLIYSQTASNSSTIDFTGMDSGVFKKFRLEMTNVVPASASVLWLRVTEDGTNWKSGASDYTYQADYAAFNGADGSGSSGGAAQIDLLASNMSTATTNALCGTLEIFAPASSGSNKRFSFRDGVDGNGTQGLGFYTRGSYIGSTNAISGVRIMASTGNIASGTFDMYGMRA